MSERARTYVCTGKTPQAVMIVSQAREEGARFIKQPLMLLRRFERYLELSPPGPRDHDLDVVDHFIASMMSEMYATKRHRSEGPDTGRDGIQARTAGDYLTIMLTHQILPGKIQEAEAKIYHLAFRKGLNHLGAHDARTRTRAYPTPAAMLSIIKDPPKEGPNYDRELALHAFWYLLVATGGRPANLRVGVPRVDYDAVAVKWVWRKGKRHDIASDTVYPHAWTGPPPRHVRRALLTVRAEWDRLGPRAWWHSSVQNMAQFVNNWLEKQEGTHTSGNKWTSTTPRNVLSTILMTRTEAGKMSNHAFAWAMDHTLETAQRNYVNTRLYGLEYSTDNDDS